MGAELRRGSFLSFALAGFSLATLVIGACSSLSRKSASSDENGVFPLPPQPPTLDYSDEKSLERSLEKALRDDSSRAMRYWVRYRQATLLNKRDASKACDAWLDVSADPEQGKSIFPLILVARIRALETCPAERKEVAEYAQQLSTAQESWLREVAARAELKRAKHVGNQADELRFSLDVAAFESLQSEQIRLIERARDLAKELKDSASEENTVRQLERIAPRLIANPEPEQFLAVAADFRKARDFNKARDYYQKVLDHSPEKQSDKHAEKHSEKHSDKFSDVERLRALDGIRMTFKLEQKTENFIQATREFANFAKLKFATSQPAKYAEARITLARAVWTDGSPSEAEQILSQLESEAKGKISLDEAIFIRARIAEEAGQLEQTLKHLSRLTEKLEQKTNGDRTLKRRIAWYHAWILRKSGRLKEAADHLTRLVMEEEDAPPQAARDHFWLGRTLKDLGDTQGANTQFEWLIANDPIGYYGTLAYRELGRPLPAISPAGLSTNPRAPASQSGDFMTPDEQLTFEWLLSVEEKDLGRRFLDQISAGRRTTFSTEQALTYLEQYARTGSYQALFSKLYELPPEIRQQILDKKPDLLFPRPWPSLVQSSAEKFSVKSELIFSIMRQESSFNPLARSSADALGLMQLIPEVARLSTEGTEIPYRSHEDLYTPEINIALGASHLRHLFNRWNGVFIPLVASYNASERAVGGWLRSRYHQDPLQFIEDIPYEETKGYVKLVMRNFVFYSRLSTAEPAIPFPEWCLNGLQDFKP